MAECEFQLRSRYSSGQTARTLHLLFLIATISGFAFITADASVLQLCFCIHFSALAKKNSISAVNEEYRTDINQGTTAFISSVFGCSFVNIAIVTYANYANANLNISPFLKFCI